MAPRSVRNNNPGNLRKGSPWFGLMPPDKMTNDQLAERDFCVFQNPMFGFRALGITLLNYQRIYGLSDIVGIITRFSPADENPTGAYIEKVCKDCGVGPRDQYDLHKDGNLKKLCRSISEMEAGGWLFNESDLNMGVEQALARVTAWA